MSNHPAPFSISLVGAGKVGSTIAALLKRRGHRIVSVISRSRTSTRILGRLLGADIVSTHLSDISPRTDLLLIAVPDETIAETSARISENPHLRKSRLIAFHPSGMLTSGALETLREQGSRVFSLHPIQTFPGGISLQKQMNLMKGIWYGFEGEAHVRRVARSIVKELGGTFVEIPKAEKILYHTACVFAANYPTLLMAAAERLSKAMGLPGLKPFAPLVETAMKQALELGPDVSLTGPLSRGNHAVLRAHLEALRNDDPALAELYGALGRFGLEFAAKRLTAAQKKAMQELFTKQ